MANNTTTKQATAELEEVRGDGDVDPEMFKRKPQKTKKKPRKKKEKELP